MTVLHPMLNKGTGRNACSTEAASLSKARPFLFWNFEARFNNPGDICTVFHG